MNTIVKADAEFVIWIIVGIFWVIAQIAGNAGKKKTKSRPQPEGEEKTEAPSDLLSELMRRLSGVQEFKIPTPPEPKKTSRSPQTWDPEIAKKYGLHTERTPSPPKVVPLRKQKAPPATAPHPARKPVPAPQPVEVQEEMVRPTMQSFRSAMPSIQFPTIKMNVQSAIHPDRKGIGRAGRLELKNRKNLRRAMLNHIILGKPKGLEKGNSGLTAGGS